MTKSQERDGMLFNNGYEAGLKRAINQYTEIIDEKIIKWEKEYRKYADIYCVNEEYCKNFLNDLREIAGKVV